MTVPSSAEFRIETDSMGDIHVPVNSRWGAQTQRAIENFPISGWTIDRRLIRALGLIKAECARANGRSRLVPAVSAAMSRAIGEAADEVAAGIWDEQFPVDIFQTGSGTSTNMNANEVIASLAAERFGRPVHPNDHVNASQSSNDVFPSAMHLAATEALLGELVPAVELLAESLQGGARRFATVVKAGRTHLMDATPVTLGQEFGGYAAQIRDARDRLVSGLPRLAELPLGGTAVGTGINAPRGFGGRVTASLARRLDLPLTEARNHFAAQAARDGIAETSSSCRGLAIALIKICNDLRWMSSGPRTGLAEIRLPALQPGSSIMPGKVNPVIPEAVNQVAAQVIGQDATVAFAASQGNFELNVHLPVMAKATLDSIRLLAAACRVLAERTIDGVEADRERCRVLSERSASLGTSLTPFIGFDAAADVVKESVESGRSVRDIVLERGLLDEDTLGRALDVLSLTRGGMV
jgi:fumarate hydratase class II